MFITDAFAQEVATAAAELPAGGLPKILFQFAVIIVVFYIIFIRPQKKKFEEHDNTLKSITKSDKIVVGGIIGTVTKAVGNLLTVEIADGVRIQVLRDKVQ
jgi:preprotein translocase subunit YajC